MSVSTYQCQTRKRLGKTEMMVRSGFVYFIASTKLVVLAAPLADYPVVSTFPRSTTLPMDFTETTSLTVNRTSITMSSELNLKPVKNEASGSRPQPTASILKPWEFDYTPSKDGKDLNLLIMFHGLGDTCAPFAKLGASLNLPHTAVLSLQAPDQLPLMDGPSYSWYNTFDRMFNPIPNPDPTKHIPTLRKLLEALTSTEIGWELNRIHLFGWGQGGSMALELASNISVKPLGEAQRLGSVISVCGPLLPSTLKSTSSLSKSQTPALVFTRLSPQSAAHTRLANDLKTRFKEVEVINGEKGKGGEDMPRGRGEWEGIMRFWGSILSKDESWKGDGEVFEVVR